MRACGRIIFKSKDLAYGGLGVEEFWALGVSGSGGWAGFGVDLCDMLRLRDPRCTTMQIPQGIL